MVMERDTFVLSNEDRRRRCEAAVARIKEFLLNAPQKVDTERLKFLLEAYEEYGSEPVILLRAHLFEKVLLNKTLYLDDNPIVGTVTGQPAGVYVYPEWDADWIMKEMNQAMMSHLGKVDISAEGKKLMREAGKYFKHRSATARAHQLSREINGYDPTDDIKAGLFTEGTLYTVGAGNVDYETFVRRGLNDIIAETEERLAALPVTAENSSKIDFYRAAIISMRALVSLAGRYAELAEKIAAECEDAERKAELLEIAETCRQVPPIRPAPSAKPCSPGGSCTLACRSNRRAAAPLRGVSASTWMSITSATRKRAWARKTLSPGSSACSARSSNSAIIRA